MKNSPDPRLDALAAIVTQPTGPSQAAELLTQAADALADMQAAIDAGEAKALLSFLVASWQHPPTQDAVERAGKWVSEQSKRRASLGTDEGSELERHLSDQIAGRYYCAPWPWPMLTAESRSLLPGSVTIICGTPGSAKSWFVLSCLRWWIEHGHNAAVCMLEETRKWHLNRAFAQILGNPSVLDPAYCAQHADAMQQAYAKVRDQIDALRERLTCDESMTMARCAEWVEAECKAGRRIIVIDPITLADNGSEKPWDADRRFMMRCKAAIGKSGASLVLVTHPRKTSGPQKGPSTMDDMAGGAAYSRACASALWLNSAPPGTVSPIAGYDGHYAEQPVHKTVRIMKARNSTGCGKLIAFQFRDLAFGEMGEMVERPTQDAPPRSRGPRLRQPPSPSEDKFGP